MTTTTATTAAPARLESIPIGLLIPNTWNGKRALDADFIASIASQGVLIPILVRQHPTKEGSFEIVAGARRTEAAKKAGITDIDARIVTMSDAEARFATAVENTLRADMTPFQEAELLADAKKQPGYTAKAAAAALGWSEIRVYRRLKLLDLHPKWRERAVEQGWTVEMAELLACYPESVQKGWLAGPTWELWNARDMKSLRDRLAGMTHSLKTAPFDVKDATLDAKAGACGGCPKRTGAQSDLWSETDGKLGKDDSCQDTPCWDRKAQVALMAKLAALKAKHGGAVLITEKQYTMTHEDKMGVLDSEHYAKGKEGDKGVVAGLFHDGKRAGQVMFVKPGKKPESSSNSGGKVEKPKGPKTLKEKRAQLEVRRWAHCADAILIELPKRRNDPKKLELSAVAALAAVFGVKAGYGHKTFKPDDWASVVQLKKPADALAALWELVTASLAHGLRQTLSSRKGIDVDVNCIAGVLGLDVKTLKERADKECPEPASWAKEESAPKPKAADKSTPKAKSPAAKKATKKAAPKKAKK